MMQRTTFFSLFQSPTYLYRKERICLSLEEKMEKIEMEKTDNNYVII